MPKNNGDKNIILVNAAVLACCSGLKPGVIRRVKAGAKIMPIIDKTPKPKNR